jgi:hypothetical protein
MFNRRQSAKTVSYRSRFLLEGLETRRLMSAGAPSDIILFSAAPTAVETGLQTLAGSTTIPANQKVHENTTPSGTTIYVIKLKVSGTPTLYAVDATGDAVPVPPPPQQSQQDGSGGTSAASNTVVLFSAAPTAVQTGLQPLAGSTTIPANQKVHENTAPDGTTIYCIKLNVDGTPTLYAVDATGTAVPTPPPPQQQGGSSGGSSSSGSNTASATIVLFSAAPSAVQAGLQTLAGSTIIPANQKVHENTAPDGTLIYCIKLTVDGTPTLYAVDATGTAVPTPPPPQQIPPQGGGTTGTGSTGSGSGSGDSGSGNTGSGNTGSTGNGAAGDIIVLFSAAPSAVQTGLQTLAGSTTIPSDQKVHENTTPDGTTIYVIKLTVDGTPTLYAVDSTGASVPVPPPPPSLQSGSSTGSTGPSQGSSASGGQQTPPTQGSGSGQQQGSQGGQQLPPPPPPQNGSSNGSTSAT